MASSISTMPEWVSLTVGASGWASTLMLVIMLRLNRTELQLRIQKLKAEIAQFERENKPPSPVLIATAEEIEKYGSSRATSVARVRAAAGALSLALVFALVIWTSVRIDQYRTRRAMDAAANMAHEDQLRRLLADFAAAVAHRRLEASGAIRVDGGRPLQVGVSGRFVIDDVTAQISISLTDANRASSTGCELVRLDLLDATGDQLGQARDLGGIDLEHAVTARVPIQADQWLKVQSIRLRFRLKDVGATDRVAEGTLPLRPKDNP